MKCSIPEISWHNREPVLSIALHPLVDKFYRLATGGADCHVLIWQLNICENGAVKSEALSDLTRHQKAVNCVRWSPSGQYLATADDDANIIIWQLKTDNIPLLEGETDDKEIWIVHKVLRGHKEDIYDLCWSPNGLRLLTGSIDNTAVLWDFNKGKNELILTDHKGFVQGVSWDPKSQYFATICTDRVCRIYESSGKQVKARIQKGILPVPKNHYLYNKEVKYFHDDTFKSFFRRLDFSPDGTLLAVPSGRVEIEDCKSILYATYLFAVDSWTSPIIVLPSTKQCSTVVRFCPILFELREDGPEPTISLPYRMIFAVGSDHDVILYDTQQATPFAYYRDIHYTRLTDLTWSNDGLLLIASSTDGFCALITFEPNELGVQYSQEEIIDDNAMNVSGCEPIEENVDEHKEKIEPQTPPKPKKPNLLEKWTIKTPKLNKSDENRMDVDNNKDEEAKDDDDNVQTEILNNESTISRKVLDDAVNKVSLKRIKPIPVKDSNQQKDDKSKPASRRIQPITIKDDQQKGNKKESTPKRIKPIAVENDSKPKNSPVSKRLKLTPVRDDKQKNDDCSTVSKSTEAKAKENPLLNFLKKGAIKPKGKKEQQKLEPVIVILDEIEARDAWKCDNDKPSEITNTDLEEKMDVDDQTEEFSLHLEETLDETEKESSSKINKENLTEKSPDNKEENSEKCVKIIQDEIKNLENKTDVIESTSTCSINANSSIAKESKSQQPSSSTEPKSTVAKRRIPLITLSSPKHKKK